MSAIVRLFEGNEIRLFGDQENPTWVATDVCGVLGIQNASQALEDFDPDEKSISIGYTNKGPREFLTVTEPGLYRLIYQSRKPEAKRFRRWVNHEVLPSIRKTGSYSTDDFKAKEAELKLRILAAKAETAEILNEERRLRLAERKAKAERQWQKSEAKTAQQLELAIVEDKRNLVPECIQMWVRDCISFDDPKARLNIGVYDPQRVNEWLYPNYVEYCKRLDLEYVSTRRFTGLLQMHFKALNRNLIKNRDDKGSYFKGVRIG